MNEGKLRDPYSTTEALFLLMGFVDESLDSKDEEVVWTSQQIAILYVNLFILAHNRPMSYKEIKSIAENKTKDSTFYRGDHYDMIQKIIEEVLE